MKRLLCVMLSVVMLISTCAMSVVTTSAVEKAIYTKELTVQKGDLINYVFNLNTGDIKITSIEGNVTYSDNLEVVLPTDAYGDKDVTAIFPVVGGPMVNNFTNEYKIFYNASSESGWRFNTDDSALMILTFKATASGKANITNNLECLAYSGSENSIAKYVYEYAILDNSFSVNYRTDYTVDKNTVDFNLDNDSSIESLTVPNSTKVTLSNCTALKTVTLGDNVTTFSAVGCSALENIYVSENNPNFTSIDGILFSKSKKSIIWYPAARAGESYTFPSTVYKVCSRAFYGATNLKKVYFSSNLTTINAAAFWNCSNLVYVSANKKLKTVDKYAFVNCTSLKTLSVPKSLSTIGSKAYGYKYSSSKWSKISTFTIRGYKSTKVYSHAKSNGLKFSNITPTKATLNKTSITLGVGQTYTLSATITPSNKVDVSSWSTSSKSVCTVSSSGKITAKKSGTATITFKTSNGKKATCKVTVKKAPAKLYLNKYSATISKGGTVNLDPKFKSGYYAYGVTFKSSNTSIATVGSTGVVKGVKKGTATITATTYNGKTATCKITVK